MQALIAGLGDGELPALQALFTLRACAGESERQIDLLAATHMFGRSHGVQVAAIGHTHVPDTYATRSATGEPATFVDTGTWVAQLAPPAPDALDDGTRAWLRAPTGSAAPLRSATMFAYAELTCATGRPTRVALRSVEVTGEAPSGSRAEGAVIVDRQALLEQARAAALHAYAPYSNFHVGAAVVVGEGAQQRIVCGANVENASYGLTLCAERAALAAAITMAPTPSAPASEAPTPPRQLPVITHVAIACIDARDPLSPGQLTPCGACRQWLAELAPDATYYIEGLPGAFHLDDLLPLAFRTPTSKRH
jgi:cytidine deaminase